MAGGVGQEDDQQSVHAGRFILGHGRIHVFATVDRPAEANVGVGGQCGQHGAAQPLLTLRPQARRKLLVQFERQGQESNTWSLLFRLHEKTPGKSVASFPVDARGRRRPPILPRFTTSHNAA